MPLDDLLLLFRDRCFVTVLREVSEDLRVPDTVLFPLRVRRVTLVPSELPDFVLRCTVVDPSLRVRLPEIVPLLPPPLVDVRPSVASEVVRVRVDPRRLGLANAETSLLLPRARLPSA